MDSGADTKCDNNLNDLINALDSESDEDTSFIKEEILTPKDIAMRKIEFALGDIQRQMDNGEKILILRTSNDDSHFQLKYSSRLRLKLQRDLICLHKVYDLLQNDKKSTKRELFYESKAIFDVQKNMDSSIKSICELLDEERSNLNILSCGRGLLRGAITFVTEEMGIVDGRVQNVLVTDILLSSELICEADFILIVEKDTTFQKLLDESFQLIFPRGILVTARGYPDISTRNVLKHVAEKRRLPVYGIFDADPHGIEIYLTYKYGAVKEKSEGRGAFVPTIQWIGLFPTDFHKFPIETSQRLPLSNADHVKIQKLVPRSIQLNEPKVTRELDWMLQNRFKMELEAINLCGREFMARYLIQPRIAGDEESRRVLEWKEVEKVVKMEEEDQDEDEEELLRMEIEHEEEEMGMDRNSDESDAENILEFLEEMMDNDSD